jgi:predicted DCC family thiol-disulfide oxidoreductase YuxK
MKDPSSIPAAVAKAGLTLPLGEFFALLIIRLLMKRIPRFFYPVVACSRFLLFSNYTTLHLEF